MLHIVCLQVLPADMSLEETALFYARAGAAAADAAVVTYRVSLLATPPSLCSSEIPRLHNVQQNLLPC